MNKNPDSLGGRINKLLANLIKEEKENIQILKIRNNNGQTPIDTERTLSQKKTTLLNENKS